MQACWFLTTVNHGAVWFGTHKHLLCSSVCAVSIAWPVYPPPVVTYVFLLPHPHVFRTSQFVAHVEESMGNSCQSWLGAVAPPSVSLMKYSWSVAIKLACSRGKRENGLRFHIYGQVSRLSFSMFAICPFLVFIISHRTLWLLSWGVHDAWSCRDVSILYVLISLRSAMDGHILDNGSL